MIGCSDLFPATDSSTSSSSSSGGGGVLLAYSITDFLLLPQEISKNSILWEKHDAHRYE